MRKRGLWLTLMAMLVVVLMNLSPVRGSAQFYPFLNPASSLLSTSYLSGYLNPYYYNTLAPLSAFGQFDPSINLDEVTTSLDILYSPTQLRTYDPSSLQGLFNFSPAPFQYIWNSLLAGKDETTIVNPYFATPFYYALLNKDYFTSNVPERVVPLPLYTLYSFTPHLPEIFYTASQAGLSPAQNYINALGLLQFPII
ncbi:MAG: hypothetical protein ACMUIA_09085 [bacterium]